MILGDANFSPVIVPDRNTYIPSVSASASVPQGIPIQQAPGIMYASPLPPIAVIGQVGSVKPSDSVPPPAPVYAFNPGQADWTSRNSGVNPVPVPAVGANPPARLAVPGSTPAPSQRRWKGYALAFAIIIGLWLLAGASFRSVL